MKKILLASTARFALLFCIALMNGKLMAQLPDCNQQLIYLHTSPVQIYNPTLPVSGTNPSTSTIPGFGGGLCVASNVFPGAPSPTFYTTSGNTFWYYDGVAWVNTNHTTGNGAAVNLGGADGFIYNLVGFTGDVYKYDGTGNATLLLTVPGFAGGGPFDLAGDVSGNFYILKLDGPNWLRKYDPNGVLLNTWTVNYPISTGSGPGFAVLCDSIYVGNSSPQQNWVGYIDNATNSITLTAFATPLGAQGGDWANCPAGVSNNAASIDTGYYCGYGPGIPVSTASAGAISWTVLSGPAVIAGSGNNITVTSTPGISKILLSIIGGGTGICGNGSDTVTIVAPLITVNAGADDTTNGCGFYVDTLNAVANNSLSWVPLNYSWDPAIWISSGATTLTPIVNPPLNPTNYVITVSTDAAHGGCEFRDTVRRYLFDASAFPDFSFTIDYGCDGDTVNFTNLTTTNLPGATIVYDWNFADGTSDTATNPVHIYTNQNTYNVRLKAFNGVCTDTIIKIVDTQHPLISDFTVDDDSVCQGTLVTFTNTGTYTVIGGPAKFFWDFGNGVTDTFANATQVFTNTGVYNVMLVITDFVPCSDTSYHIVVVDSLPTANFTVTDSVLCEGQGVTFLADYTPIGNTGINWDFGDGNFASDQDQITHAYDSAGNYTITLNATYRICPDANATKTIIIHEFPRLDLGPDTVLCPNGDAILIGDFLNGGVPGAKWLWNTGDVTPLIGARHPGVYTLRLDIDGCTTADSVEVFKDCYIDIPNTFSPNGDGANDYFIPRQLLSKGITKFKMSIFNRWGQVIFETDKIDGRGWDGKFNEKEQPVGVYVYLIEATLKSGNHEKYQGNVTLIR